MAYIDDWYNTPADDRKRLIEVCTTEWCKHLRYQHGDTRELREGPWRTIEHTEGKCKQCKCSSFGESPITKDDIVDVHDWLKTIGGLKDLGIGPLMCQQVITSWTGLTSTERVCLLEHGHEGAHVT